MRKLKEEPNLTRVIRDRLLRKVTCSVKCEEASVLKNVKRRESQAEGTVCAKALGSNECLICSWNCQKTEI